MKNFIKSAGVFFKAMPHFLLFEIMFKLVMVALGAPVLAFLLKWTMKMSGIKYLSDENVLFFLKHPITIVVLIIILFFSAFFSFVELSALTGCFSCFYKKKRMGAFSMVRIGLDSFRKAFRGMGILDFVGFMFCSALAQFTLSSGVFMAPLMPILRRIFRSVKGAGAVAAYIMIQLLFVILIVSAAYSLHYLILTKMKFHDCVKESKKVISGHKLKMIAAMLGWILFVVAVIGAVTFGLSFVIVFVVKGFTDRHAAFRTAVKVLKYAGKVFTAMSAFFSAPAIVCWLTGRFYRDMEDDVKLELPYADEKVHHARRLATVCCLALLAFLANISYIREIYKGNISLNVGILTRTQVTAHRGASKAAPENTMPAFEAAIESGADYIELDVQLTKDGELVVFHDDNIKRTTNGNGILTNMTYDELQKYSAGSWFKDDGSFDDVKIPKLSEVLELVGHDILLNIEIKSHGNVKATAEKVVELVEEYDIGSSCYITSFSYQALKKVKELQPKIKTALIANIAPSTVYSQMKYIDAVSMNYLFVNSSVVNYAHHSGKKVFVWTVDRSGEMKKMMALGVDNIITNRPEKCLEVVDSGSLSDTVITALNHVFGS
jgi:glycerophosphoryl diester phosphodiesterase